MFEPMLAGGLPLRECSDKFMTMLFVRKPMWMVSICIRLTMVF